MASRPKAPNTDAQNVTVRVPFSCHVALKDEAKRRGRRSADHYCEVVATFLERDVEHVRRFYATPRNTTSVTVSMPVNLIEHVRAVAAERGFNANELILTAIYMHLDAQRLAA